MTEFKIAAFADEAAAGLDGQINALRRNGIELIELRSLDGFNVVNLGFRKALNAAAKLQKAGIGVWSIGSPIGKTGIDGDLGAHLEAFKRCLDLADVFGAKHLRMFSFYVDPGEKRRDHGGLFRKVAAGLSEFVNASAGRGVVLCHENEKGIFGERPEDCLLIHREFPEIKAVFDPANYLQAGEAALPAFEMLEEYVEYLHIKDLDLKTGEVVPAGRGDGDIPEILRRFKRGTLTIEPHLKVFKGLEKLEREGGRSAVGNTYGSRKAAFDAAVEGLAACLPAAQTPDP